MRIAARQLLTVLVAFGLVAGVGAAAGTLPVSMAVEGADDPAGDDRPAGTHDGGIDVTVAGTVAPGSTVTVTATRSGAPVAGADVHVKDGDGDRKPAGRTDADGRADVTVPADGKKAGDLNVKVRFGELEGEFEYESPERGHDDGRHGYAEHEADEEREDESEHEREDEDEREDEVEHDEDEEVNEQED